MSAEKCERARACEHPEWVEVGDGHGHNSWTCTICGRNQWIAPWVLTSPETNAGGER